MEFWGAEVKSGEPLLVTPGEGLILHLSQASLGEVKKDKGNESVSLFVNIDGKKLVLGTLSPEKLPQQLFDLVFDRNFELTHNWKNGSVYFYGYKVDNYEGDLEDESGMQEARVKQGKPPAASKADAMKDSASGKQKVKIVEPSKDVKPNEDDDTSDESDYSTSDDETSSEEDSESSSVEEEDSDDEDSDDEVEGPPKMVEPSKKRSSESAAETSGSVKKAKMVTPQKTNNKKDGGHVATPHPLKRTGKTPANKPNQQTPKSEGPHSCKSCDRSFKSENALESHNKAKHSVGK